MGLSEIMQFAPTHHALALLAIVAIAGCTLSPDAKPGGTVEQGATTGAAAADGSANANPEASPGPAPSEPSPTPSTPAEPPTAAPPPAAVTSSSSNATVPTAQAREIRKSFELSLIDAGPSSTPIHNCVYIRSPDASQVHNGTANAKSGESPSVVLSAMELRFSSVDGEASSQGSLPLDLSIPTANLTDKAEAYVLVQASKGQAAGRVVLDIMLYVTGSEPVFSVGNCRAST